MSFFDLNEFVRDWGLIGIGFCIFAETGLFLGFFLPGESLLISAGVLASTHGSLNIWQLALVVFVASTLGNQVSYMIGRWLGPSFRKRPDGRLYKQKYLQKADKYFERYGNRTILFARFIPIVRTFGPLVAGIARMDNKAFWTYNILGGIVWSLSMPFLGYLLGDQLERHGIDVETYILPIIIVVVLLSISPALFEYRRDKKEQQKAAEEEREKVDIND